MTSKLTIQIKNRTNKLQTEVTALYLALGKPETPMLAKLFVWTVVAYALSPIDLIPDFLPLIGYLDDAIILPLLITLAIKFIPANVLDQCRLEAQSMWGRQSLRRWYYALPIVAFWVLIICLVGRAVVHR